MRAFLDTEEVGGSNPLAPTRKLPPARVLIGSPKGPPVRWRRAPQHPPPHRATSSKTLHHVVVTDDPITVSDDDDGLAAALSDRINEFNTDATGFDDGRWLRAAQRGRDGSLEAGLAGWTWGGCGYIEFLWVRADLRGAGLGSRLLAAAEAESRARGCAQMVVSSHSFQAPDFYRRSGYVEYGRIEGCPRGHTHVHLVKDLRARPLT
jgi:ribosomal protein S18 acetylase RimI-like enzyme